MLKLTHSFCRYSRLTCENINYITIVRQITQLSFRRKICITWNNQQSLLSLAASSCIQWRHLAYIKKRYRFKKSHLNSNAVKTHKQMSEPIHPSLIHVSHGGQFNINEPGSSTSQWQNQIDNTQTPPQEIPHDFRIWESVDNGNENNKLNNEHFSFKVMSYNVLAQYLLECHPYLYTECAPINLNWKVRSSRIFDEILTLSPDILCLQEVEVSHLNSFYYKFEEMGYFGIYKQKTGDRKDGCAIYFKPSVFDLQDHLTVEFYQPEMPILNRDNIGLMVKLSPKESPDTPLVVATTHLLYNPKRTDVRLAQIQVLLAELDRFAFDSETGSGYLPIILTGDLNSTPDSAVIQLLDNGHICASQFRDHSDWTKIGVTDNCQHLSVYLNREKGLTTDFSMIKIHNTEYMSTAPKKEIDLPADYNDWFNNDGIGHPFKLASVYHKIKYDGSLEVTTFQDYWVTVDYIYFSVCKSLKLVERLRLPTEDECSVLGKLPNNRYGSDHLSLAATFQLKLTMSS